MCIAIVKPKGTKISEQRLFNSYRNNPDGAGFAYVKDDKVVVEKGFFNFATFLKAFTDVQENLDSAMLLHFRIATSGGINPTNCHPWKIDDRHALIHNGILNDFVARNLKISDTGVFTENIVKPMFETNPDIFRKAFGKYLIEEAIGMWNKLAILSADGDFVIYNEGRGDWDDGVWYSNRTFAYYYPKFWDNGWKPKTKKLKKKEVNSPPSYRKVGETHILTMSEINKLTHDNHCKLIDLVIKKVVEAVPDEEIITAPELSETEIEELAQQRSAEPSNKEKIPVYGTPAYEKRWHERVQENLRQRFHQARQEAGAE